MRVRDVRVRVRYVGVRVRDVGEGQWACSGAKLLLNNTNFGSADQALSPYRLDT